MLVKNDHNGCIQLGTILNPPRPPLIRGEQRLPEVQLSVAGPLEEGEKSVLHLDKGGEECPQATLSVAAHLDKGEEVLLPMTPGKVFRLYESPVEGIRQC